MIAAPGEDSGEGWARAATVAALLAVDPAGLGGVSLRALAGPARDAWIATLRGLLPVGTPVTRLPLNTGDDRLLGGLDLVATLRTGRAMAERGILARADGGVVLLAMAERVGEGTAARLNAALDVGELALERDGLAGRFASRIGVVALDEGMAADERPLAALLDRLAFLLDLDGLRALDPPLHTADDVAAARLMLPRVEASEAIVSALCSTAIALGVSSLRAASLALRVARCCAALDGREAVSEEDATLAGALVLGPRATRLPASAEERGDAEDDPAREAEAKNDGEQRRAPDLADVVLASARANVPAGVLSQLQLVGASGRAANAGKAGARREDARRGRPVGNRRGELRSGARLDVVATLRAAAPWQAVRRMSPATDARRLDIRPEDFRVTRFEQRSETTVIFVVDASGSSALNRLAEAKGAVELLLADCYVRRDQVALLAFRGVAASLLLPPTNSLVRAKRSLAGLAGGGGTPLATAVDAAAALADAVRRRGPTPLVILLTDGRANVARDGTPGRARAADEASQAARAFRSHAITALLIDTSPKPQPQARALAQEMGGTYLPLPYADSATISRAVRDAVPNR